MTFMSAEEKRKWKRALERVYTRQAVRHSAQIANSMEPRMRAHQVLDRRQPLAALPRSNC